MNHGQAAAIWEHAAAQVRWLRARVEFRVDASAVYFVEVSSVPAMTRASVHACCAEAAGLSFEDVAERILLTARLKLA